MSERHLVLIDCEDRKGLVSDLTRCLFERGLNVVSNDEFVDPVSRRFFMRTEVEGPVSEEALVQDLDALIPKQGVLRIAEKRQKRLVVMVTRESHCIGDLLIRAEFHEMNGEILAVVGNHEDLRPLVERFGLPFHVIPHEGLSREAHEARVLEQLAVYSFDYLVLAKYMRILTPAFVSRFFPRAINIHHSFLPAFMGAKPYRQAFERGVKIIGATAHFVSEDLDQGPIIAQDTVSVAHHHTAEDMARIGRDVEKIVLARALNLVLDDRVFVSGNKTVIFA